MKIEHGSRPSSFNEAQSGTKPLIRAVGSHGGRIQGAQVWRIGLSGRTSGSITPMPPLLPLGPWAKRSHPLFVLKFQHLQNEGACARPQLETPGDVYFCHGIASRSRSSPPELRPFHLF